ncbi:hypothetical protein T4A_4999 [Trichinella pseudospiralis]|uniref:Uncharacterized protein n=1 Tax=Trichinella pseudospiralis TaxID=6337 RepID=A0A0V1E997_TRIPS|nr:hypothetical protein T4A_4999 [Trichinella pseudospiralis]
MLLDTTFLPVQQVDTGDSLLEAGITCSIMQITIAITVPYHQYREWRREKKNKNADDTVLKSIDGTKQIKRKQEPYMDNEEKIK